MEPFLGMIALFPWDWAPNGWARCDGQLLPINQNSALFSLIGTTYGGNGTTTFALPDLRGRAPIHDGSGNGLSPRTIGEVAGQESVTLTSGNLPAHQHTMQGSATASSKNPTGMVPAFSSDSSIYGSPDGTAMGPTLPSGGSSTPVSTMPPFVAMNYCIALNGVYPSRG